MKYLCLGYYDTATFDALTEEDFAEIVRECTPHDERLHATGQLFSVGSLQHRTAVTIRPGDDGPVVTDGPFAEAKEVVGAFFIVEADGLHEAVRIASLHPAAQYGAHLGFAIEVRPIERHQQVQPAAAGTTP